MDSPQLEVLDQGTGKDAFMPSCPSARPRGGGYYTRKRGHRRPRGGGNSATTGITHISNAGQHDTVFVVNETLLAYEEGKRDTVCATLQTVCASEERQGDTLSVTFETTLTTEEGKCDTVSATLQTVCASEEPQGDTLSVTLETTLTSEEGKCDTVSATLQTVCASEEPQGDTLSVTLETTLTSEEGKCDTVSATLQTVCASNGQCDKVSATCETTHASEESRCDTVFATHRTIQASEEHHRDTVSATRETTHNDSTAKEGQPDEVSLKDLKHLIYSEDFRKIKEMVLSKHIAIFVGLSKCGKSSLINAAIGNTLHSVPTEFNRFKISKNEDTLGPEIDDSSVSKSTIPTAWYSRELDCFILDAPGFYDNRGVAQDIANAFQLKEVVTRAASVKIVLIADINDILLDNIHHFRDLLDLVKSMFPNLEKMFEGLTLVLTKDRDDVGVGDIQKIFSTKIVNADKLFMKNKILAEYFMKNLSAMSIVRMPKKEGVLDNDHFDDMFRSIKGVKSIQREVLVGASPGISKESREFLLQKYSQLTEGEVLKKFLQQIKQKFDEVINEYNPSQEMSLEEVELIQVKFDNFHSRVNSVTGKNEYVNDQLRNMCILFFASNYKHIVNVLGDINDKLEFSAFIDNILKTNNCKQFDLDLNILIDDINMICGKQNMKYTKAIYQIKEKEYQKECTILEKKLQEMQEEMAKKDKKHSLEDEKMCNDLKKYISKIQETMKRNEETSLEESRKYNLLEKKFQESQKTIKRLGDELKARDKENIKRQREQQGFFTKTGIFLDDVVRYFNP